MNGKMAALRRMATAVFCMGAFWGAFAVPTAGAAARAVSDGAEVACAATAQTVGVLVLDRVDVPLWKLYPETYGDITHVTLAEGVTTVPDGLFAGCTNLASVTIPRGVTGIGSSAFKGCTAIREVIWNCALSQKMWCVFPDAYANLTNVVLGAGVASIGYGAFSGCSGLTSVTIPAGVASIEYGAFSGCSGLASVTIPAGVTSIGSSAFYGCSGLASVTIPAGVTRIENSAFYGCSGLKLVVISADVTSIGYRVFGGCSGLMSFAVAQDNLKYSSSNGLLLSKDGQTLVCGVNGCVTIPDGVTNIGDSAFHGYSGLTSVMIPAGVTNIGYHAFSGCSGLMTVMIPNSVTSIGHSSSSGSGNCVPSELTSVTSIEGIAFSGCSGLMSFVVAQDNPVYSSPNGLLLSKDGQTLVCGVNGCVTIPGGVTRIGDFAFSDFSGLTSVMIPDSVTSIGNSAFSGCSGLTSAMISDSVTSIGWDAFSGCSSLTSVTIPDGVTSIGECAFEDCADALFDTTSIPGARLVDGWVVGWSERIAANLDLSDVRGLADGAFCGCEELVSVRIPDGVTRIGYGVFSDCSGLTSVVIPDGVTSIGDFAFSGCSGLTSVMLPDGVTSIGYEAFCGCSGLRSVTIPDSVTSIGYGAFESCVDIRRIELNCDLRDSVGNELTLRDLFADSCENVTEIVLGAGVTRIGDYAFSGCSRLTSLVIPEGVTRIGELAFSGCSSLRSVTIPNSVTNIEYGAFSSCSGLTSVTIPDGVTSIGYEAFFGCSKMTSVTIPASVTRVGWSAFEGCTALRRIELNGDLRDFDGNELTFADLFSDAYESVTEIVLGPGVTRIGDYAFSGFSGLASVAIPDGVTNIGNSAFEGCSALTSVTIPGSVTNIGDSAFSGCSALTSVTIPDGVTNIGNSAFSGCSSLTSVVFPDGVTRIGDGAFFDCSGLTSVTIPEGVTRIGNSVFSGCSGLTSVTISASAMSIDGSAFEGCGAIRRVELNCDLRNLDGEELRFVDLFAGSREHVTEVVLGTGVTSIGDGAFEGCSRLRSVTIPDSVTRIGNGAFEGCVGALFDTTSIPGVHLVDGWAVGWNVGIAEDLDLSGVRGLADGAFCGCGWLVSVRIPDGVTSIGDSAFSGCSGLTSVAIPNSVRRIGDRAFEGCEAIQRVELNCDLRGLDGEELRFSDLFAASCERMTEIVLGTGVTHIGDWAFSGCGGLTSVAIPAGVTSIGDGAFSGCSRLTSVTIPNGVTSIGYLAFEGCSGLTSVTIPDSVTRIGEGAFSGCGGLTSMTIPNSVTSIGYGVFESCGAIRRVELNCDLRDFDGYELTLRDLFADSCESVAEIVLGTDVTRIGEGAFSGCGALTSVAIPDGVTSIGSFAFSGCSALTSVTIPGSVTNIGDSAFSGCSGLTSVTISDGVTSIGNSAFSDCSGLTSVMIPASVTGIGYGAFEGCTAIRRVELNCDLRNLDGSKLTLRDLFSDFCEGVTEIVLGSGVTCIGNGAFDGCAGALIDTTTIPGVCLVDGWVVGWSEGIAGTLDLSGVRGLADSAFYGCEGLVSVRISGGVTRIGDSAFEGCSGLTSVVIPDGVTSIGDGAFFGCSGLTSVTIPNGVTRIGEWMFSGCSGLTSVTIPDSVTSVGRGAFDGCDDALFDDTTIPGVRLVDGWVVGWNEGVAADLDLSGARGLADEVQLGACDGLVSVRLPASMTSIGDFAFAGCCDLTSLVIPNGVTRIGDWAFEGCSALRSVTIPEGVTHIGNGAFSGCSGLTSVTIPAGVTRIGDSAFSGCSGLTSVTIPEGVTHVGDSAFGDCSALTSVTIPSGVTSIEGSAFEGCVAIRRVELNCDLRNLNGEELRFADLFADSREHVAEVVLGTDVTYIGEGAFSGFSTLTSVTIPEGVTRIGDSAFFGCSGLTSVTIPDGVTRIGDSAFSGCSGLTAVAIPASVTRVGWSAFEGCTAIQCVELNCDVKDPDGGELRFSDLFADSCESVTKIVLGTGVTRIGEGAFFGFSALTSVAISDGVASIGSWAFECCSGLMSVTLPEGLVRLGAGVFAGCTALRRVQFLGDAPTVDVDAYAEAPAELVTYVVDGTRGWDGRADSAALPVTWPAGTRYALRTWTPPCVRVTFDAQGGEPATVVLEETIGKTYRLPRPAPTRLGATFLGWWTETDAGAEVRPTTRVVLTGDHILYARWRLCGYTVAFDANGGVGAMASVARTVGAAAALPPSAFRRAGRDFAGWALEPDGEAVFADGADPGDLAHGDGDAVTLYAVWRERAWTAADWLDAPGLVFSYAGDAEWRPDAAESHDGVGSMRSGVLGTAPKGTTVRSTLKAAVRGQGVLSFWWKVACEPGDPETDDLYDYLELTVDGARPASVAPIAGEMGWARVEVRLDGASAHEIAWSFVRDDWDDEEIVYADAAWVDEVVWTPDAVTLSFDGNDATDGTAPDRIVAFSGAEVALPGPGTLVRDGCRFVGWSDGERTYVAGETYAVGGADMTFTALWKVLSLGDVLNAPGLSVVTGGDSDWWIDFSVSHDGEAALRSGAVEVGQTNWVETTVTGAGTLAFWWKADDLVHRGRPANYVDVSVDGVVAATAAVTNWTLVTVQVEGSDAHVVRWTYRRTRKTQPAGEICAWLDEVAWTPAPTAPGIVGDAEATVTGDAKSGFVVTPGTAAETVEVVVPDGLDAAKVTVAVPPTVKTVRPNGAKVRVVRAGHDITAFLDLPESVNGVVAVGEATVKAATVKEVLDPAKGAVIRLDDPSKPSLKTAPTKPGLVYTLREGATLDALADGDTTVGDGKAWTPAVKVKGGASGFYTIRVSK